MGGSDAARDEKDRDTTPLEVNKLLYWIADFCKYASQKLLF